MAANDTSGRNAGELADLPEWTGKIDRAAELVLPVTAG